MSAEKEKVKGKIRAAFVSVYGEIGETYNEEDFNTRFGAFFLGWGAAMEELSQQATNTGSTPPEAGSAHA